VIATARPPLRRPVVFRSQWPLIVAALLAAILVSGLMVKSLPLGIGAAFLLLYAPLLLLNLPLGIAAWVPLTFLDRMPVFSVAPTLAEILLAVAWIGALPVTRRRITEVVSRHAGIFATLLLYCSWVTASPVWAKVTGNAGSDLWTWWVAGGVFVVVATSAVSRRALTVVCFSFVVGAVLSVLAGAIPNGAPRGADVAADEAARLAGSFGDPNIFAAGLGPGIALAIGLMSVWRGLAARVLLGTAAAILFLGLVLSASRGALAATACMAVVAVVTAPRRRVQSGLAVATVFAAILIAERVGSSSSVLARIRSFDTGNGRIDLWTVAWRMARDHPILGVGDNNFIVVSRDYLTRAGAIQEPGFILTSPHFVHNTFLQMFAETGIVGIGLFCVFLFAVLRVTWRATRQLAALGEVRLAALTRSIFLAQVGFLAALVFLTDGNDNRCWVLLGLGVGSGVLARRLEGQR